MYAYIIGDIKSIYDGEIILENNGIGYKIFTSQTTINEIHTYETYKIYTEYITREDGVYLYGFSTEEELEIFKKLIKVSSIGPKAGMSILSTLSVNDLKYAIHNNDIDTLTKAPGIGKKSAGRIILEIKDKIDNDYSVPSESTSSSLSQDKDFAIEALVNLGYVKNDVQKVIEKIKDDDLQLEEIIKLAMKTLENKG
ncbi:Holliday junction branch migration protein RuvA [Miniphocaeibacter massiliensis]|uniref:Holliday junction branch migration protein RuvA n=1 Tax=Miniphocaeibacter massiliensis TaxID=2041841 RepID=UPI000C07FC27|nr:Holliday junction branch migration protein RuvA [Miniphocaeibacter massiliensis]